MSEWHVDAAVLEAYASNRLPEDAAWSVEQHMTGCASCRALVVGGGVMSEAAADRSWAGVAVAINAPRPRLGERLLLAIGVPDTTARLLVATPSMRAPWLVASLLVLVAAGLVGSAGGRPTAFLVVAALSPVAAVAAAFGSVGDPSHELTVASPMDSSHLLLVRAVAVSATATALSLVASLLIADAGLISLAWVLPGLALTVAMLALSTVLDARRALATVVTCVLLAIASTGQADAGLALVFGAQVQIGAAALIALGLAVLAARSDRLGEVGRR